MGDVPQNRSLHILDHELQSRSQHNDAATGDRLQEAPGTASGMDVPRPRLQRRQVMGSKPNLTRLARTLSLAALAAPGWAAPHPQIPIWDATAVEKACGRTLTNARAPIAVLGKPSPSPAPAPVICACD